MNLRQYVKPNQIKRFKRFLDRRLRVPLGIRYAFQFKGFQNLLCFVYSRKVLRHNTFMVLGETYHYFDTVKTWLGERAVELPIVMKIVRKYQDANILEIGNVLAHHVQFQHDVLDKYETVNGVINEDVVDFKPKKKYDLIVSVSTLEHVGWDERPRDDMKIPRAIGNLRTLITPRSGTIIVTLPLGYNSALDKLLKEGIIRDVVTCNPWHILTYNWTVFVGFLFD
jgi:hypothetical protein